MTASVSNDPRGELTVRLIAMPSDTNANGDIFGGWVLSQMDQAGGIAAAGIAQGRVVTIAIEAMTFIRPVKVGDVLCVYTHVDHAGIRWRACRRRRIHLSGASHFRYRRGRRGWRWCGGWWWRGWWWICRWSRWR